MMLMKRNVLLRTLCIVLCAVMLVGTMSAMTIPVSANTTASATAQADNNPGVFRRFFDSIFRNFGLIGFVLDPHQFTMLNQRPAFQWILGFNEIYDVFPWVMNVWTDSIRVTFNYDNRDWLIQFWKGGYGMFLATGGEIGIYTRVLNFPIKHYNAPISQRDWMDITMHIYNRGERIFTRPSPYMTGDTGPYWWVSGYRLMSFCTDFLRSPRANVVMDATLELHSAEMARLFIAELEDKGFTRLAPGSTMNNTTADTYMLLPNTNDRSVRLIWRYANEGWF
jgi:hypothetical protein